MRELKLPSVEEAEALLSSSDCLADFSRCQSDGTVAINRYRFGTSEEVSYIALDGDVTRDDCLAMIALIDAADAKRNETK